MLIEFKTKGLKKARNMMLALGKMGAAYRGIEFPATSRKGPGEKGTNADVIDHLREGGRDIGPNEDDAQKAAEAYVKHAEIFMRQQRDVKKPPSAAKANEASAKAFRAAGAIVQKILVARVDKGEDMNGQVIPVDPAYAKARAAQHEMVDDVNVVLKASGQLDADLARATGKPTRK